MSTGWHGINIMQNRNRVGVSVSWAAAILVVAGCAQKRPAPFEVSQKQPRSDRPSPFDPVNTYPEAFYDQPAYVKSPDEPQPEPRVRPDDPLHFFTNKKVVMVRRPGGYNPEELPRVSLWWSNDSGYSWQRAGYFGRGQSYFPFEVAEDGDYGVRFVGPGQPGAMNTLPLPQRVYHVDRVPPAVELTVEPEEAQYAPDDVVTIRWRAEDYHLVHKPVRLYAVTDYDFDGGHPREIQRDLDAEGAITYTIPMSLAGSGIRIRMEALDRAGNLGLTYSHTLQIIDRPHSDEGLAAATGTKRAADGAGESEVQTERASPSPLMDREGLDPHIERLLEEPPAQEPSTEDAPDGGDSPEQGATSGGGSREDGDPREAIALPRETNDAESAARSDEPQESGDPCASENTVDEIPIVATAGETPVSGESKGEERTDAVTSDRTSWGLSPTDATMGARPIGTGPAIEDRAEPAPPAYDTPVSVSTGAASIDDPPVTSAGDSSMATAPTPHTTLVPETATPGETTSIHASAAVPPSTPDTSVAMDELDELSAPELAGTQAIGTPECPAIDAEPLLLPDTIGQPTAAAEPSGMHEAPPQTEGATGAIGPPAIQPAADATTLDARQVTLDPTRGNGLLVPLPATVYEPRIGKDAVATLHPWRLLGRRIGGVVALAWELPRPQFEFELNRRFKDQFAENQRTRLAEESRTEPVPAGVSRAIADRDAAPAGGDPAPSRAIDPNVSLGVRAPADGDHP